MLKNKLLYIYSFLVLLVFGCLDDNSSNCKRNDCRNSFAGNSCVRSKIVFNISKLQSIERLAFINIIDSLEKQNQFFRVLREELNKFGKNILIEIDSSICNPSFIIGKRNDLWKIRLPSIDAANDSYSLLEEIFHAFQASFYKLDDNIKECEIGVYGASNIEFEAKFFKAIVSIYYGQTIGETPSQKGLINFTLGLLDKSGKFNAYKLTEHEKREYISLVNDFRNHWHKRNIDEGMENLYDDPVNNQLGPMAAFYILEKVGY